MSPRMALRQANDTKLLRGFQDFLLIIKATNFSGVRPLTLLCPTGTWFAASEYSRAILLLRTKKTIPGNLTWEKGNQSLLSKELLINLVLSRQGLFASVGAAPMAGSHHNIFRSARTSCTTFGWFVRPSVRPALKIWITYIQAYMPYES